MPDSKLCPPAVQESIQLYVEHRVEPGSFVRAVLENDLIEAFAQADEVNIAAMAHIAAYVYWEVPGGRGVNTGSKEIVDNWLSKRRENEDDDR